MTDVNPFRFGSVALDESFTDRDDELAELLADARAGQDVVVLAPRRLGKTSLVWRLAQRLAAEDVLVAQVDLMTTPTPARFAARLARAIHEDVAGPKERLKDRLEVFRGLRIRPSAQLDPDGGDVSLSFDLSSAAPDDVRETIERLLQLPGEIAADRGRRVVLVFDEFQEVLDIDPGLPRLMRAVFQAQPDVARIYLGSRRHLMRRLFDDHQEPFWRSAKQLELGVIPPEHFVGWLRERFAGTGRTLADDALDRLLEVTGGHPYATQELAYFLWAETPRRRRAGLEQLDVALTKVLRSEHAHFSLVWERATGPQRQLLLALAAEPGRPFAQGYRTRHGLPSASTVQRAAEALERDELTGRRDGVVRIVEPFLREWLRRERAG